MSRASWLLDLSGWTYDRPLPHSYQYAIKNCMTGLCSLIDLVLDHLSGGLLARRLESVQTALSAGVVGDAVVFIAIGDVVSGLLLTGDV